MVRKHSLSNTDEGVAIFVDPAEKEVRKLDATQSRTALTAIINCLDNDVPKSVIEKPYETCQELEQLRQGDLRIYVKLVTDLQGYTLLWIFAVKKHRYRNLGKFDARACRKVADLEEVTGVEEVETYLDGNEALTVGELKGLRGQL